MGAPGTRINCENRHVLFDFPSSSIYQDEDFEKIQLLISIPCHECGSKIIEEHNYYDYVGDCCGYMKHDLLIEDFTIICYACRKYLNALNEDCSDKKLHIEKSNAQH